MKWYLECWRKYVTFSGRARRREYWMFALFNIFASFAAGAVDFILVLPGTMNGLYSLAVFLPGLAVSVRRLHDTDRSGWWFLINFIPIVGAIVFLLFLCQDSKPGDNRFGANPKE